MTTPDLDALLQSLLQLDTEKTTRMRGVFKEIPSVDDIFTSLIGLEAPTMLQKPGLHFELDRLTSMNIRNARKHQMTLYIKDATKVLPEFFDPIAGVLAQFLGVGPKYIERQFFVTTGRSEKKAVYPDHFDPLDAFVIHLHGRKNFSVSSNPAVKNSMFGDGHPYMTEARTYKEAHRGMKQPEAWNHFEMDSGGCLWMPRGHWHTTASFERTYSMTLFSRAPTVADCVSHALLDRCNQTEVGRTPSYPRRMNTELISNIAEQAHQAIDEWKRNAVRYTFESNYTSKSIGSYYGPLHPTTLILPLDHVRSRYRIEDEHCVIDFWSILEAEHPEKEDIYKTITFAKEGEFIAEYLGHWQHPQTVLEFGNKVGLEPEDAVEFISQLIRSGAYVAVPSWYKIEGMNADDIEWVDEEEDAA